MTPRQQFPSAHSSDELIFKQNCSVRAAGFTPGLFILGSRGGYRWLAKYFDWYASQIDEDREFCKADPDDHQHLGRAAPINVNRSDEFGVTVGSFTEKNRKRVFKSCGASKKKRVLGSPIGQFRQTLVFMVNTIRAASTVDAVREQTLAELEELSQEIENHIARLRQP